MSLFTALCFRFDLVWRSNLRVLWYFSVQILLVSFYCILFCLLFRLRDHLFSTAILNVRVRILCMYVCMCVWVFTARGSSECVIWSKLNFIFTICNAYYVKTLFFKWFYAICRLHFFLGVSQSLLSALNRIMYTWVLVYAFFFSFFFLNFRLHVQLALLVDWLFRWIK